MNPHRYTHIHTHTDDFGFPLFFILYAKNKSWFFSSTYHFLSFKNNSSFVGQRMILYFYPTTSSTSTTFGTIINQQWFTDHLLWVQLSGELAMVICVLQMKQREFRGVK